MYTINVHDINVQYSIWKQPENATIANGLKEGRKVLSPNCSEVIKHEKVYGKTKLFVKSK